MDNLKVFEVGIYGMDRKYVVADSMSTVQHHYKLGGGAYATETDMKPKEGMEVLENPNKRHEIDIKRQAFPSDKKNLLGGNGGYDPGFTKLEYASLMIAQGIAEYSLMNSVSDQSIAQKAVNIAMYVLEEANK